MQNFLRHSALVTWPFYFIFLHSSALMLHKLTSQLHTSRVHGRLLFEQFLFIFSAKPGTTNDPRRLRDNIRHFMLDFIFRFAYILSTLFNVSPLFGIFAKLEKTFRIYLLWVLVVFVFDISFTNDPS